MRLLPIAFLLGLAACGQPAPPEIQVRDAWARETAPGQHAGAVYLTIDNRGETPDRLVAVATDRAPMAMTHENISKGGIARMRMVDGLDVPAGGSVALRPGGSHVMLDGLKAPLVAGDRFDLRLRFEKSGEEIVPVTIEAAGA